MEARNAMGYFINKYEPSFANGAVPVLYTIVFNVSAGFFCEKMEIDSHPMLHLLLIIQAVCFAKLKLNPNNLYIYNSLYSHILSI